MKQKTFFIIFKGVSMKQITQFFWKLKSDFKEINRLGIEIKRLRKGIWTF